MHLPIPQAGPGDPRGSISSCSTPIQGCGGSPSDPTWLCCRFVPGWLLQAQGILLPRVLHLKAAKTTANRVQLQAERITIPESPTAPRCLGQPIPRMGECVWPRGSFCVATTQNLTIQQLAGDLRTIRCSHHRTLSSDVIFVASPAWFVQ